VPRALATLRGELAELLSAPEHEEWTDHFLSVTLTDRVRPVDAMRKLRDRFPHAVHLDWQPAGGLAGAELKYAEAVRGRSDIEIARNFLDDCRGAPPSEREERLVFLALEAADRAAVAKL
jgi:exonuclease SbcD